MLNVCIFEGRLTRDPETRTTPTGTTISSFTIAVDRTIKKGDKPALFLPVTFYGNVAENASKFLRKGRAVICIGRLENDVFEDKDNPGQKKTIFFLNGTNFEFPLTEKNTEKPQAQQEQEPHLKANEPDPTFRESNGLDNLNINDDELPWLGGGQ